MGASALDLMAVIAGWGSLHLDAMFEIPVLTCWM
jgi:hypothetical protein